MFAALLTLSLASCKGEKQAYLFSYFAGQNDGLHLAYSYDGKCWEEFDSTRIFLKPAVGPDKLMRDPSVVRAADGTFHMVWTTGWHDRCIGYASTRDFVSWTEQKTIPVMEWAPQTHNSWAPEVTWDDASQTYYIYWASTVPDQNAAPEVPGDPKAPRDPADMDKGPVQKIYYTTTKDFETFAPTAEFFSTDFSVIDAAIVKDATTGKYIMALKNESRGPEGKTIRVTVTDDLSKGFPSEVSAPITGDYWAEGPSPLFVGDTLYVYFDKYTQKKYGAVRSLDHGQTWEDVSDEVSFPKGIRHGTAIPVPASFIDELKAKL